VKARSRLKSLKTGAFLLVLGTAACSLVVDTSPLQEGDKGLGCAAAEKVCPDPAHEGRGMCVSTSNPSYGCNSDACGACSLPNATPHCLPGGGCVISTCQGTHDDCNGKSEDGCEVDLAHDQQNCGSCGNVCKAENGSPSCSNKTCVIVYCASPYADCDQKYSTGCETNTDTSSANCGGCNKPCAKGMTCVSGVCQP